MLYFAKFSLFNIKIYTSLLFSLSSQNFLSLLSNVFMDFNPICVIFYSLDSSLSLLSRTHPNSLILLNSKASLISLISNPNS